MRDEKKKIHEIRGEFVDSFYSIATQERQGGSDLFLCDLFALQEADLGQVAD